MLRNCTETIRPLVSFLPPSSKHTQFELEGLDEAAPELELRKSIFEFAPQQMNRRTYSPNVQTIMCTAIILKYHTFTLPPLPPFCTFYDSKQLCCSPSGSILRIQKEDMMMISTLFLAGQTKHKRIVAVIKSIFTYFVL